MKKQIPAILGLCESHEDELLTAEEIIAQHEKNALVHFRAMRTFSTLCSEWYWRRALLLREVNRALEQKLKLEHNND